jgi:streptogramin lyase
MKIHDISARFNSGLQFCGQAVTSSPKLKSFSLIAVVLVPCGMFGSFAQAQAPTNFGSVPVATTTSATAVPMTFTTAGTLGSVAVLTQGVTGLDFASAGGSTCTVGINHNVGDTCSVNVTFKPGFAGIRYGAVLLEDASGNVLATSYVQGTGQGPQVIFNPGTESTVPTSTLNNQGTIAIDGNGSLYIADTYNNRVLKETLSQGAYTESTIPTSSLNEPEAVGIDAAGNIYITDTTNQRILKETPAAGGYTESVIPTSPLNYPICITTDGSGNVFIVDVFNNRILMETLSGTSYTETVVPTSTLNTPTGVAVDASGNLYITDYNMRLLKETLAAGTYTESTIPTSTLNYPAAVSVDALNNVIISDVGNNRVLKETPVGSSYTESTVPTGTNIYPFGAAIDGLGNIYVSDTMNNRVLKEDLADTPGLSFANTVQGSTSSDSPKAVTVTNYGNSTLTFSGVTFPIDFPENSSASNDCTASTTLSSTVACTLTINFTPISDLSGNPSLLLNETVTLTTNNLTVPATQQTITVSGTELQP